jgi:hypothetical protein
MKSLRVSLLTFCFLVLYANSPFAFSTHNTYVSRSFDKTQAAPDSSITVTVSFANYELDELRGFYYTEQIPVGLTLETVSIKIADDIGGETEISNYTIESGSSGDVYPGFVPNRWIIETPPPPFDENNPISTDYTLEIVYTVSSPSQGTLNFSDFSWVGYYETAAEGEREAFGHSVEIDQQTIIFTEIPVANDDSESTDEDNAVTINVVDNDTDADGSIDPTTVTIVTNPANGVAVANGDGTVTYTPDADFNGTNTFTYTVKDDLGAVSDPATVTVTIDPVNDAPVAQDGSANTDEDTSVAITLSASDIDGDGLTYAVVTPPANGNLSGTAPDLTYTPNGDYNGSDSFTFRANDGAVDSNIANVAITVNPTNDAPVAQDGTANTDEDTSVAITLSASDIDGDALTYAVVTPPANGSLSGTAPDLTYTPNGDYNGSDSFTFKANDGTVDSNTANVAITVAPVNDAPVADADSATTDEDNAVTINVVDNDTDVDSAVDPSTVNIITNPANGTAVANGDGTVTYTPEADFNGVDTFTYTVKDDLGATSVPATVTVTVNSLNDPPVAQDDNETTLQDRPITIDVISNDSDLDGTIDPTSVVILTNPANGTVEVYADGTVVYTPDADFYGTDSFTYTVKDNEGETSNEATVTVTVRASRLGIDRKIKEFKGGEATEEEVKEIIEKYMEGE